jgi:hypothetical protein
MNASFDGLLAQIPVGAVVTDFTPLVGIVLAGNAQSVCAADDADRLAVRSQTGFLAQEPNLIHLLVGSTTTVEDADAIDITIEAAVSQQGGIAKIGLRNWSTGAIDHVATYAVPTQNENNIEFSRTVPLVSAADRIRADGRIELSVKHVIIATFSPTGFESYIDQVRADVYHGSN